MNTINVENCKTLLIGRRGENEVTTVAFDFTEWASEFGSGVVDLYVKRFGDDSAYPVVLTIDGTVASWLVTETDTNVSGYGKAEYVYRVDGKIAKSAVFPFFVAEDIGQPASEPPDPYESWLEQLTALGAETEAHAQAAEQSAENAAESAEDAAQSAASAEGYAGQAETAAGLAQAAQTASEAARDAAQTAQASAEASATAASGSAASAAGSASDASSSASDASASASTAGASATAASASATTASNAATQAEAAKTAAQAAQSAAEDAAEDAQEAAQQAHVEYEQLSGEVDDLSDEVTLQKSAIENVEASLATVETTSTASRAYAVGELLVYNNRLYRVASVIAAGATLTPGTNIIPTTVETEISEQSGKIADIGFNKSFGQYIAENVLCPDFDTTRNGREFNKTGNLIKMQRIASSTTIINACITGDTVRFFSSSLADYNFPDAAKIPVTFLATAGATPVCKYFLTTTYTGTGTARFYVIWFKKDDTRVVNAMFDFAQNASGIYNMTPPADAVSFCLVDRTNSASMPHTLLIDFDIVSI